MFLNHGYEILASRARSIYDTKGLADRFEQTKISSTDAVFSQDISAIKVTQSGLFFDGLTMFEPWPSVMQILLCMCINVWTRGSVVVEAQAGRSLVRDPIRLLDFMRFLKRSGRVSPLGLLNL
jgi:hypothetical protein